jgi:hypothetical protein
MGLRPIHEDEDGAANVARALLRAASRLFSTPLRSRVFNGAVYANVCN